MNLENPASILAELPKGSRILILRLRSLGDTVLLTPSLAALHSWRPDLRISVVLEEPFAAVLEGNPAVHETLVLRGTSAAVRAMRSRNFRIAYNQHSGPRSAILTALCGAPVRVSWAGRQFSFIYNAEVPGPEAFYGRNYAHTAEHAITQFYWTGLPQTPVPAARVYPQSDAVEAVEHKLAAAGIVRGRPYAVLRPGASSYDKRWPLQNFLELARWIRKKHDFDIVTNIGAGDAVIAEAARGALGSETVFLDSLDVRELVALLAGAQLFVGNDTGPTHVAAALNRRVVAIFGASNLAHWRPWRTRHRIVRQAASPDAGSAALDTTDGFDAGVVNSEQMGSAVSRSGDITSITVGQVREACNSLLAEPDSHEDTELSRDPAPVRTSLRTAIQ